MFCFPTGKIFKSWLVSKADFPFVIGRFGCRSGPVPACAVGEVLGLAGGFSLLVEGGFDDIPRLKLELVGFFGSVEICFEEKGLVVLRPAVGESRVGNLAALFFIELLHFFEPDFGSTVFS